MWVDVSCFDEQLPIQSATNVVMVCLPKFKLTSLLSSFKSYVLLPHHSIDGISVLLNYSKLLPAPVLTSLLKYTSPGFTTEYVLSFLA